MDNTHALVARQFVLNELSFGGRFIKDASQG